MKYLVKVSGEVTVECAPEALQQQLDQIKVSGVRAKWGGHGEHGAYRVDSDPKKTCVEVIRSE